MNKLTIVINGKGGSGKDTVCAIAAEHYGVVNVSSIDPIKKIALDNGWNGEKDRKSRKFLSDLKQLFSEFNDLPTVYLQQKHAEFMSDSSAEILFVHIREPDEIEHFIKSVSDKVVTLCIERPGLSPLGNASDDETDRYSYDYYYQNDKPLNEIAEDFLPFFRQILQACE